MGAGGCEMECEEDIQWLSEVHVVDSINILSQEAIYSMSLPNAGGNSEFSEALSIEIFKNLGASNFVYEMEVKYFSAFKMVDYIMNFEGDRVGVSVTRAMIPKPCLKFDYNSARKLLHRKIYGLIVAKRSVMPDHSFSKSIMHVWAQTLDIAYHIKNAFHDIDPTEYGLDFSGQLKLVVTVNNHPKIYKNNYRE